MPPRSLSPSGIILADKPAGPSSFAIVAAVRRKTGARTGHAGTLDPFATGLLLLLSGASTRLQPRFVGLDKRYVTEIDLGATTTTGDPEGEVVEEHEPPRRTSWRHVSTSCAASSSFRSRRRPRSRSKASARTSCTGAASRWRCRRVACTFTRSGSSRTRTASRGSTCSSPRAPTSARSPRRSAGIAARFAGRRSGRSRSRRRTPSTIIPPEQALARLEA